MTSTRGDVGDISCSVLQLSRWFVNLVISSILVIRDKVNVKETAFHGTPS